MTSSASDTGILLGSDGRQRCGWAGDPERDPLYASYHDEEWGVPVHGRTALFERIMLEAFQSGLSWITILRKRDAFRSAFVGFDPEGVARFGDDDVERLLLDASIVRNRAKIEAARTNARVIVDQNLDLDEFLWSFAPMEHSRPRTLADVPAVTAESTALARALKKAGMAFVGPTTAYALMQATGMVDDHLVDCWVRPR
ncbi:MAG: DNA-3-methyladenine glycosylase I [Rhodococcus sp. (in: high G+C Gram-positive bacteria)]